MSGPSSSLVSAQLASTVQVGGRTVGRDVLAGIHDASRKTGVDFAYMLAKADHESGFRTDAANPRGSARGLFQFTDQTWLETVRRHGAKHGLGAEAAAIERDARGRLGLADKAAEARLLTLREDPRLSAIMAAEYADQNRAHLRAALGRPVGTGDVYLAHFLGPGGAVTFLKALAQDPTQSAAAVLPKAARNNPSLFTIGGRDRSLDELRSLLHGTIAAAVRRYAGLDELATGPPPAPPGAKPVPPQPEDMGHLARSDPDTAPLPSGRRPLAPGLEDMGRTLAQADAPLPTGPRPVPPGYEDMGATQVAAAAPVPPGPRPASPAALPAGSPPLPSEPAPAPPDVRIAQADSVDPSPSSSVHTPPADPDRDSAARAEALIAAILGGTRDDAPASAPPAAPPDPVPDLPGPTPVAVSALLDAAPPARHPGHSAQADAAYRALARAAGGLFDGPSAPHTARPTAAAPPDTPATPPAPVGAQASIGLERADHPLQASVLSVGRVASGSDGQSRLVLTMPPSPAPTASATEAPAGAGTTALRRAPDDLLAGAARTIASILGRDRSG